MTESQWDYFVDFRGTFQRHCENWNKEFAPLLEPLQKGAASKDTPSYPVETGVVYNQSLDEVTEETDIKLIVIGDNPGKDEQLRRNRRYLVGQAGKIGAGFFARNPQLAVDFRKNTIILNKTPVHTAKTAHLRYLLKHGPAEIVKLIEESQVWMAEQTAALHQILCEGCDGQSGTGESTGTQSGVQGCQLWLVGYAELKDRGLFLGYRDKLADSYCKSPAWEKVLVYQHFSMNRFTIDLKECIEKGKISGQLPLQEQLAALGKLHRQEIFGR